MTFEFRPAVKEQIKLRLAVEAPSGAGKTWTSLSLGTKLVPNGRVGLVDTERHSASLYASDFTYQTVDLTPPFTPERYIKAIEAAAGAGLDVLIIDSGSHEWQGTGGVLQIVDQLAGQKYRGNKWAAWSEATPRHQSLIDAIKGAPFHVIVTLRSKMETAEQIVDGKKEIVKLGLAAVARDDFPYEFDVVASLDINHVLTVTKSRCRALDGYREQAPDGTRIATILRDWLTSGPPPADQSKAIVQVAQAAQPVRKVEPSSPLDLMWREAESDPNPQIKFAVTTVKKMLKERGYAHWADFLARHTPDEAVEVTTILSQPALVV